MYQKLESREIKGLRLVSQLGTIVRINKLHYKVKSESNDDVWYTVKRNYGSNLNGRKNPYWSCTCADWKSKHIQCKHAWVIIFSKKLRENIIPQDSRLIHTELSSNIILCLKCKTDKTRKDGKRYNKGKQPSQKYLCLKCNYRFTINTGFENSKKDPTMICACIDMYFKGMSLRKVADHVKQFYGIKISNVSVLRWVQRFGKVVAPFVDSLIPNMGGVFEVDEMMVHTRREEIGKGHYQWLWNYLDESSRFWVSSMISQRREVSDARKVFADAKKKCDKTYAVIHDGLHSYNKAFQQEFFTLKNPRVKNIRSISVKNDGLNCRVERLNGTMRDRERVMRGMQTKESAQKII